MIISDVGFYGTQGPRETSRNIRTSSNLDQRGTDRTVSIVSAPTSVPRISYLQESR